MVAYKLLQFSLAITSRERSTLSALFPAETPEQQKLYSVRKTTFYHYFVLSTLLNGETDTTKNFLYHDISISLLLDIIFKRFSFACIISFFLTQLHICWRKNLDTSRWCGSGWQNSFQYTLIFKPQLSDIKTLKNSLNTLLLYTLLEKHSFVTPSKSLPPTLHNQLSHTLALLKLYLGT